MARREADLNERMRRLPAVDAVSARLTDLPAAIRVDAARAAIAQARGEVSQGGDPPSFDDVVRRARSIGVRHRRGSLVPVINATGVLLHTNLGRAPLGERQIRAVERIAAGYSNLEFDLQAGERGDRYSHAGSLLGSLTGAESGLVVNNNAAAVLLVLSALCRDREVIISRGELVEIGGSFRIPDVMAQSGAHLVEVGTTNRTRLSDYEGAIGERTAAVLKVHRSNFRLIGFTSSVEVDELARLAHARHLLLLDDLGSGVLADTDRRFLDEPSVDEALTGGSDVVTFSGDKLLGGPQCGIIVGRRDLIERMRTHPLLRALRVDKMTLAALEETLLAYLEDRVEDIPLHEMLMTPPQELERRARAIVDALERVVDTRVELDVVRSEAVSGGGSLPGVPIDSWAVAVTDARRTSDQLHAILRNSHPPVLCRIQEDRLMLDLAAVPAAMLTTLRETIAAVLS